MTDNSQEDHNHCRFYHAGGLTIQLESDLPFNKNTFLPQFKLFETDAPGKNNILIKHCFSLPSCTSRDLGPIVYRKKPWIICRKDNTWNYINTFNSYFRNILAGLLNSFKSKLPSNRYLPPGLLNRISQLSTFNIDHTKGIIYHKDSKSFLAGDLNSLTLFPTDQIVLARTLAEKHGCYIHASGVVLDGKGFLFVGHSEAGKSTIAEMLKDHAEILCDDRIIVRKKDSEFNIHGTWSHGDIPDISSGSAPLKAILFLKQSTGNQLISISSRAEAAKKILACLVRPLVTLDWWDKMLALIDDIADQVPSYTLEFDKSGKVVELLKKLH